jgi:hypothetical protein
LENTVADKTDSNESNPSNQSSEEARKGKETKTAKKTRVVMMKTTVERVEHPNTTLITYSFPAKYTRIYRHRIHPETDDNSILQ